MKNLFFLLFVAVFMLTNCEDKKKNLTAKYDELMKQADSIEASHQDFMKTHNEMADMHDKFKQQLEGMELQDSTVIEDIAKHDVILKRHDVTLESHTEMFENHKNLKSEFDAMTNLEMEAKIEEMEQDHEKIKSEHATMEDEHNTIMNEHDAIEKALNENQAKESEED